MNAVADPLVCASIPTVVSRHAEEAALLCGQRFFLVRAGHVRLHHLRRLDDRLAAHLDGLGVAGDAGRQATDEALANLGPGEVFASFALALDNRDDRRIAHVLALAEAVADAREAAALAVGWVSAQSLRGIVGDLLVSREPLRRAIGIAACDFHRVDPGGMLADAMADASVLLRAQALQAAGDCGRQDLVAGCIAALEDEDAACRFWAARSAVLLGERHRPVPALLEVARVPGGPYRTQALALLLKLAGAARAAPLLRTLAAQPGGMRDAIRAVGVVGDVQAVPWLAEQMAEPALARLAGEAFTTITGVDLAWNDLECKPSQDMRAPDADDPEAADVAMDDDEGLPWPDPGRLLHWWEANAARYPAAGERCFMGQPPSWPHCLRVLRMGCQRQRAAAAAYLCLLRPGTQLFPTGAPAWRQARWLVQMSEE
ncbi:conserved hypothetical protein [Variovorax sp. OK605]|uniref:TIGR02270 family protein n=1 Tax=Variovorax sp. OK605 TaxID=1855317 RepID=UPI0008E49361|nr:TIGR02270 family protein [Variovorax sp. OK605]SFP06088.1 conserved hypothetical protein [Variovorax sp. OK605]